MASIISAGTTSGTALNMAGDTSGVLQLATNGSTTAITIDTSQNVGIGTASPAQKLDVNGDITFGSSNKFTSSANLLAGTAGQNGILIRSAVSTASNPSYSNVDDTNTGMFFPAADTIAFAEGGTEAMRITSSGNLFVGTSSALFNVTARQQLQQGDNSYAQLIQVNGSSGSAVFFQTASTGGVGSISLSSGSTAYNTTSDYRLKENIAPMTGALDKVAQLKPVTYKWKIDGSDGQGFIAHELAEVVPDCVTGEKDAVETYTDEEGIEQTRIKPQGIDTSFLVATLTAAIQEQQTIINDLKARITALEDRKSVV
jgi:hypothetical protein